MSRKRIRTPSTAHVISARAAVAALSCTHADVIVYDARNEALVALERVAGAISWDTTTTSTTHDQGGEYDCAGKLSLVYDAGSDDLDCPHSKAALVCRRILAEHPYNARICLVAGGLPALKAIAPRLIVVAPRNAEEMIKLRKKLNAMKNVPAWANDALEGIINSVKPAAAIFNWLYVGSDTDARSFTNMKTKSRYTHILTVGAELCVHFPQHFDYLFVPALDTASYRIVDHLRKTTAFLRELRRRFESGDNVKCLVHCYAGMSRSVTIVAAFLVAEGMHVDNALSFIASKRIGASPNHGFISQLKEWKSSLDANAAGIKRRQDERTLFNTHNNSNNNNTDLRLDLPTINNNANTNSNNTNTREDIERGRLLLERDVMLHDCIDRSGKHNNNNNSLMPIDMSPVTPAQPMSQDMMWDDDEVDDEEDDDDEDGMCTNFNTNNNCTTTTTIITTTTTSGGSTTYLERRYYSAARKMNNSSGNTKLAGDLQMAQEDEENEE